MIFANKTHPRKNGADGKKENDIYSTRRAVVLMLFFLFSLNVNRAEAKPAGLNGSIHSAIKRPVLATGLRNNGQKAEQLSVLAGDDKAMSAYPAWYDQGWRYRRAINLSGLASGAVKDYQVAVKLLYYAGGKADYSDVRFTSANGVTPLGFWKESYVAGSGATFFVKVPSIAQAPATTRIFVYYGNQAAKDASDAKSTFSFYDGFETPFGGAALKNAPSYLSTPTADGSGEATHPDIVYLADGWRGYRYWMAMTPYPGESEDDENPSILASNDGIAWTVPAGLENPLVPKPPCDHNNDPTLIYHPETDELWLYYMDTRRADRCAGYEAESWYDHNMLRLLKSKDGISWSSPVTVFDWDLESNPQYLSPSVVRKGAGVYRLWVTNGIDEVMTYASADGLSWNAPQPATLSDAWHFSVEYVPAQGEFWSLSYTYGDGDVVFARSADGVNWTTYPQSALLPTSGGWDYNLYQPTFFYESAMDKLRVWYSAYSGSRVWHIGYTEGNYTNFLSTVSKQNLWKVLQGLGTWTTSSEKVKRGSLSAKLTQYAGGDDTQMIVHANAPAPYGFYQEWDLYDDLAADAFKVVRAHGSGEIGIGVYTGNSSENYSYHDQTYTYYDTGIRRSPGWHKFGLIIRKDGSAAFFIDDRSAGSLSGQFSDTSAISVEGYNHNPTQYFVDDIRVRKYVDSEPSVMSIRKAENR